MNETLGMLRHVGLLTRVRLTAGAARAQALTEAGEFLLRAYGNSDSGRALAMTAPAFALAWCEAGFPSVAVGHRLAASMMCTSFTDGACEGVRPPWRCFHIAIPAGILSASADLVVLFTQSGDVKVLSFCGGRMAIGHELTLGAWANLGLTESGWEGAFPDALGSADRVTKESKLLGRVFAGVCVETDTPRMHETVALGPRHRGGVNKRGEPASWAFQLSRDVTIDLREHVQSFVTGARGGKLSVQHLVRGHWKRQATGEGGVGRTWIHVEPYWRGEENAPLPLRSHRLP